MAGAVGAAESDEDAYLARHEIAVYLADALALLSESKAEEPLQFLSTYFDAVASGEHVLFRRFRFVNRTQRNRECFESQFNKVFQHISHNERMSLEGVHQLLCLLCPDFPFSLLRNAARISVAVSEPPKVVQFGAFKLKLFTLMQYAEFMNKSALLFRELDADGSGAVRATHFLDRLEEIVIKGVVAVDAAADDADAEERQQSGQQPSEQHQEQQEQQRIATPSLHALRKAVANSADSSGDGTTVMFNVFCVELFSELQQQRNK